MELITFRNNILERDPISFLCLTKFSPYSLSQMRVYNSLYSYTDEMIFKFLESGCLMTDEVLKCCRSFHIRSSAALEYTLPGSEWKKYHLPFTRRWNPRVDMYRDYGIQFEDIAIDDFLQGTHHQVFKIRNIVNPYLPYLICSPDAILWKDNGTYEMVEVKSKSHLRSIQELADHPEMSFGISSKGNVFMKRRNKEYLQIQLCMLLSGTDYCNLLLHLPNCEDMKKTYPIRIELDYHYLQEKIFSLQNFFYKKLLPLVTRCVRDLVRRGNNIYV